MSFSSLKSSILFSIRPFCTQVSVTVWLMQRCCRAALEVSSGLLCCCRAPLGAVMCFIPSITGMWRPGNIALRAHTGHRWRSKTCRYAEIAEVWDICWSQESLTWERLNKALTTKLFWGGKNMKYKRYNRTYKWALCSFFSWFIKIFSSDLSCILQHLPKSTIYVHYTIVLLLYVIKNTLLFFLRHTTDYAFHKVLLQIVHLGKRLLAASVVTCFGAHFKSVCFNWLTSHFFCRNITAFDCHIRF